MVVVCKCGVPDIVDVDAPVRGEDLPLARHLPGPLLHAELLSEAVAATGNRGQRRQNMIGKFPFKTGYFQYN